MNSHWLSTGTIAKYCGVDRATVLRWIKNGQLPAFSTPGGHRRVSREDFHRFLVSLSATSGGSLLDIPGMDFARSEHPRVGQAG